MSNYNRKDHLYTRAKKEGYRSRAAYKLLELNKNIKFIKAGDRVLELGSFPGGWLQVAAELIGAKGQAVGVDLRPLAPFKREEFSREISLRPPKVLEGDVNDEKVRDELLQLGPYDVVLSDMSPQLSGISARDAAKVSELFELAFNVASKLLRPGGWFVAKEFPSPEVDEIFNRYNSHFKSLARTRLKATRTTSNELYVIGKGFLKPDEH